MRALAAHAQRPGRLGAARLWRRHLAMREESEGFIGRLMATHCEQRARSSDLNYETTSQLAADPGHGKPYYLAYGPVSLGGQVDQFVG
jgi:hypothetical protein